MTRHVLSVDLGTGSCRAIIFDEDGNERSSARREWSHPSVPGVPGSQVFDTDTNWRLICASIQEAIQRSGISANGIAAVSTTSMREGMVLYDASGREIWACPNVDARAHAQAQRLVETGAAREIYDRGGDWVAITSPARFLWIKDRQPEILARAARIGMLSDWVITRLTGEFVTDPSNGSSSNLFDLSKRAWSPESLALIGVGPALVPRVLEPGSVVGPVMPEAADETGLTAGTPVVVGGADTQLGLVGIGVVRPNQLTLVGGSFWQLTVVTDAPLLDPEARLRTLCHAVEGQWMTEGIGFYCGIAMRWLRDAFCRSEKQEAARLGVDPYLLMEAGASTVPPGANGLIAVFSNVMNAKRWVQAPPTFVGFDVDQPDRTGPWACVRALEEQATFATRGHLEIIEELTKRHFDEVLFTGGAAKGNLWPQILADVLQRPVHVPTVKESSALGAAIFAGVGVGIYRDLDDAARRMARIEKSFEPDRDLAGAYDEHYQRWGAIYPRLLALAEEGLARPMWWPPGVPRPARCSAMRT